ncbi:MAG: hypothetical protein LBK07_01225 [Tannerella sp.]|jgi:hypothetical protein|nr:hypothetical protein [Tannerella sp.]
MSTKNKILSVIAGLCLFAGTRAQEAAGKAEPAEAHRKFMNELVTFLGEEGFTPALDSAAGRITFKKEGETHWIAVSGESPFFVATGCNGYDPEKDGAFDPVRARRSGDTVSLKVNAMKVYCTDTSAILQVEQYARSAEDFKYVFFPSLRLLDAARKDFAAEYGKTDPAPTLASTPDPKPAVDRREELHRQYLHAAKHSKRGLIVLISGAALIGVGAAAYASRDTSDDALSVAGSISLIAGAGCVGYGVPTFIIGSIRKGTLREYRNVAEANTPRLQLNLYGNRVGLAYVF